MAAKPFRLATLVKLRESTRDDRRASLAEAYRAETIVKERIAQVDADLAALIEDYRRATRPGHIDVDPLIEHQRQEGILLAERKEHVRQHEMLIPEIERRRQALVAADREVRVLEKLREKQAEREFAEELRQESKVLDEFGTQRAARWEEAVWAD